jgi:hypothetical protein
MRRRRAAPACAPAALLAAALVGVGGCASHPKAPQAPAVPPPPPPPLLDASYDWHVLQVAPFGDVFKSVPLAMHEVLLFKEAQGGTAEDAECYAMEEPAPQFIKRTPREFLLCFRHDRLARIEATVMLPAADAAQILADACGLWLRNASAAAPPGSAEAADASPATAARGSAAPNECEGRDGATGFSARLDEVDNSAAEVPLAIQLDERSPP